MVNWFKYPSTVLRSYSGSYREDWGNQRKIALRMADFPADLSSLKLSMYPLTERFSVSACWCDVTIRTSL